jgi:hypothetical protein
MNRTLPQALQDFGLTYEDLRHDIAFIFGKSLNEAAGTITHAWANNELETLLYEAGY